MKPLDWHIWIDAVEAELLKFGFRLGDINVHLAKRHYNEFGLIHPRIYARMLVTSKQRLAGFIQSVR